MDKYEYNLKLDQMKTLVAEQDYQAAAEIADTINWRKIKNVPALVRAGEIYEQVGQLEKSKDILLMAYDRSPIGRMIIYRLACVAIKMHNFDEAKEYYDEFVEIAPHDNLKYVLKYELNKAKGSDYAVLAENLEKLKEQEFTEEWGYELACLYHQAGMSKQCIETCDEIILYFGSGIYVERALELKMLYQPLNEQQEEIYSQIRRQEQKEIAETLLEKVPVSSDETKAEEVQIPEIEPSAERFNTQNLQEELQKSMLQIMNATEKETVKKGMDTIKMLVGEFPYLQLPVEKEPEPKTEPELEPKLSKEPEQMVTDEKVNDSLKMDVQQFLNEEYDGQMSLLVPDSRVYEPQVSGQLTIEDILTEWEKTKSAVESALQEEEQVELESMRAKALQEAEDIMERLADVIPKLDSEFTSRNLLKKQRSFGQKVEEDHAAQMVANMNQMLQKEIERLSSENAQIDEQLAEKKIARDLQTEGIKAAAPGMTELTADDELAELFEKDNPPEESVASEELMVTEVIEELLEAFREREEKDNWPKIAENSFLEEAAVEFAEIKDELLPEIELPKDLNLEIEIETEIDAKEDSVPINRFASLSWEQRELFPYLIPIKGMEEQICAALNGVAERLERGPNAQIGHLIVQGGTGNGKTNFATNFLRVLQQETGKPEGKVGKIKAEALNKKDMKELFSKIAGGCLIIEGAGGLTKESAQKLTALMEKDTQSTLIILEDTRRGIEKALACDSRFAYRFSEKVIIPVFTSDELVTFAKTYAAENGYKIDEMGILALYNCISNIQKIDRETTVAEVKEIVDGAIFHSERGGIQKVFSILASKRFDDEDYVILREKDFNNY